MITRTPRPTTVRGSASLGAVVALVIFQLILVGAVLANARDQDVGTRRLESVRTFYAAEAAANMAFREVRLNVDADGDGSIGGISDNGSTGDDPVISGSRASASISASGSTRTVTVSSSNGSSRRKLTLTFEAAVASGTWGGSTSAMAVFTRNNSNQPRYAVWPSGAWGSNQALPSVGAEPKFVRLASCPTRSEMFFMSEDNNRDLNISVWNGSSWSTPVELIDNSGTRSNRPFDVAYEGTSGRALIVYWDDVAGTLKYRTRTSSTLSSASTLSISGANDCDYLTLYADKDSNTIVLLCANEIGGNGNGNSATRLSSAVWNGSSWGSWTHLNNDIATKNEECYAMTFESQSGHGLAVYAQSGSDNPRYRTWNGSTWSSEGTMPSIGATARWIRLAPDPQTDVILFAALDGDKDVNVNRWSGSAWGSNSELETATDNYNPRQVDIAFERSTSEALIIYCENTSSYFKYRTWNGSSWSSEQTGPYLGDEPRFVHMIQGQFTGEVLLGIVDNDSDLHLMRWSGSGFDAAVEIDTSIGSLSSGAEPIMLAGPGAGLAGSVTLNSWYDGTP